MTETKACPFEEGDRVDHRKFGLGTVSGAPVATVGPDVSARSGVRDAGWRLSVTWDDPDRSTTQIMSSHLTKVASPDTRPYSYWNRQWQPLLTAWRDARKAFEIAAAEFRPIPDEAAMSALHDREQAAWAAMQTFIEDERVGRHS